jgi:alpha-tubulin suppressor-like RCC1 family protein
MLRGVTGGFLVAVCALALAVPAAAASAGTFSWGEDEVGQLGDGATINSDVPAAVSGLGTVTALAGGRRYSLALLGDGTVMAWGENSWGQLGDGTDTGPSSCYAAYASASGNTVGCSTTPVTVSGLNGVVAIATGAQHSLALLSNGTVMAWGANEWGQLGIGTTYGPDHCYKPTEPTQCSTTPVPVNGLSEVTAIAAGQNDSFALLKDGTVMAWGSNAGGDLGVGAGGSGTAVPTPITGLSGVTGIAAGGDNGLALLRDGTVMSWGTNEFGQLGDGALTQSDVPVAVSGLSGVSAIAIGGESLALREDGTVVAWGSNIAGQLGIGTRSGPVECFPLNFCGPTPVEVSGIEHASAIAAGGGHSLALLSDGTVLAWGLGWDGQLGDGTTEISDVPVTISGLEQVTTIAAGDDFGLAYGVLREPAPVATQTGSGDTPTSEGPARTSSPSASQGVASLMVRVKPPFPLLAAASEHKPLTLAQKLRRALNACRRKPKAKRGSCERRARKQYAPHA